MADVLLFA